MARRASRRQTAGMTFTKNAHLMPAPDDDSKWRAVLAHDRRADTLFVYGVSSTGIYCRPSVPQPASAARPRRVLRLAGESAAREGYRACRRCRPNEKRRRRSLGREGAPRLRVSVQRRRASCPLARLAARAGRQPVSPPAQLQAHRRRHAARVRRRVPPAQGEARTASAASRVTAAMVDAGYGSSSRFYERAAREARDAAGGLSARRRPACRSDTRSSIRRSGGCWWRRRDRGVCAVSMGSSDSELERALWREYPAAACAAVTAAALARWTRAILSHLAGRQPRLDLPLDVQATAFQWQVWTALAAIPYGETRTYEEVAASIGRPVGRARRRARLRDQPCGARHPVSPGRAAAGGPGGYRWGTPRKTALLAAEHRIRGR